MNFKSHWLQQTRGVHLKMLCITAEKSQRNYFSTWTLFPVSDSLTHSPPALTLFGEMMTGRFNKSIEYLASRYSRALADSTCRVKQRTRKIIKDWVKLMIDCSSVSRCLKIFLDSLDAAVRILGGRKSTSSVDRLQVRLLLFSPRQHRFINSLSFLYGKSTKKPSVALQHGFPPFLENIKFSRSFDFFGKIEVLVLNSLFPA